MDYYGPSTSSNNVAAAVVRPPMRPMSPLIFNYSGIKIQEVINEQYRYNSQQRELEIGQHILLDV